MKDYIKDKLRLKLNLHASSGKKKKVSLMKKLLSLLLNKLMDWENMKLYTAVFSQLELIN